MKLIQHYIIIVRTLLLVDGVLYLVSLNDFSQMLYHPYLVVTYVEVHVEFLAQFALQEAHFHSVHVCKLGNLLCAWEALHV